MKLSDITFGAPSGNPPISWRTGHLADWEIILGEGRFSTHKAILARGSQFFAASVGAGFKNEGKTDLTNVLAPHLHCVFERVLDAIYELELDAEATDQAILLFEAADILGIKSLFHKALADIKAMVSSAPDTLLRDIELSHRAIPPSDKINAIKAECIAAVCHGFSRFKENGLHHLSDTMMADILMSEHLAVKDEDEVFDFIWTRYNPVNPDPKRQRTADGIRSCLLWSACRLPFVSYCRLLQLKLQADSMISPDLQAMVANAHQYRDILHHSSPHLDTSPVKEFVAKFAGDPPSAPRRPQHISPPSADEVDFLVHIPSIVGDPGWFVDGPAKQIGNVIVAIRAFPYGTASGRGKSISLFIVVKPAEDVRHINWQFELRYSIRICAWGSNGDSKGKRDRHLFTGVPKNEITQDDRGWHDFFNPREEVFDYCKHGFLFVRGSVSPI